MCGIPYSFLANTEGRVDVERLKFLWYHVWRVIPERRTRLLILLACKSGYLILGTSNGQSVFNDDVIASVALGCSWSYWYPYVP